jgi:hypothetical protein
MSGSSAFQMQNQTYAHENTFPERQSPGAARRHVDHKPARLPPMAQTKGSTWPCFQKFRTIPPDFFL